MSEKQGEESIVFQKGHKELQEKEHQWTDEQLYPQQEGQLTCWERFKRGVNNFLNRTIDYFQFDRIFMTQGQNAIQISRCHKRFLENYDQTYSQRQARFAISFDYALKEKIREEQEKQKHFCRQFYRFICCEGGNEMDEIEQAYKSDREYEESVKKQIKQRKQEMLKEEEQEKKQNGNKDEIIGKKNQEQNNQDFGVDEDFQNQKVMKRKEIAAQESVHLKRIEVRGHENVFQEQVIVDSNRTQKKGPEKTQETIQQDSIYGDIAERQLQTRSIQQRQQKRFKNSSEGNLNIKQNIQDINFHENHITRNIYHQNYIYNGIIVEKEVKKNKNIKEEEDAQDEQMRPRKRQKNKSYKNDLEPYLQDQDRQNSQNNAINYNKGVKNQTKTNIINDEKIWENNQQDKVGIQNLNENGIEKGTRSRGVIQSVNNTAQSIEKRDRSGNDIENGSKAGSGGGAQHEIRIGYGMEIQKRANDTVQNGNIAANEIKKIIQRQIGVARGNQQKKGPFREQRQNKNKIEKNWPVQGQTYGNFGGDRSPEIIFSDNDQDDGKKKAQAGLNQSKGRANPNLVFNYDNQKSLEGNHEQARSKKVKKQRMKRQQELEEEQQIEQKFFGQSESLLEGQRAQKKRKIKKIQEVESKEEQQMAIDMGEWGQSLPLQSQIANGADSVLKASKKRKNKKALRQEDADVELIFDGKDEDFVAVQGNYSSALDVRDRSGISVDEHGLEMNLKAQKKRKRAKPRKEMIEQEINEVIDFDQL